MRKILKKIYSIIPFKKNLFTIVKSIFNPEEKIYKHLHFKDVFTVKVKEGISFRMRHYGHQLENNIFWKGLTGRWEKQSMELWIRLNEKANVVMDIGANTGIYSLVSKAINPKARVMAFEPVERVFNKLQSNIELNNFNTESYLMAVSDKDGEAVFYDTDADHTYTVTINKDLSQDKRYHPVKVKIKTIDSLIKEQKIDHIDLVKIDVETHEPEVMKGFSLIKKYQPNILIEILSDEIGEKVQNEIELYGARHIYFDIDEETGPRRVKHIRRSSGMNFLLTTETKAKELQLI